MRMAMSAVGVTLLSGCLTAGHVYPDGSGIEGQLEREIMACKQQLLLAEEEGQLCGEVNADSEALYANLVQVLGGMGATVGHDGGVVAVTLPTGELFSERGLSVRREARPAIDMVATAAMLHKDYEVVIEGHTSDLRAPASLIDAHPTQWHWGFARAQQVAETLQEYGLEPERISVVARADTRPLATNDTRPGQAANDRVVVYLYPPGVRR